MKKKDTEKLFNELSSSPDINDFLKNNTEELATKPIHEYLLEILNQKQIKKSHLANNCGLERTYVYHILSGQKHPSRDKLIIIAIAIDLIFPEIQRLLKYAGYRELYARDPRDSILIYSINSKFSLLETNTILHDFNKDILQ